MQRAARIAVIGGGIGGLTAALALRLRGFEPRIYEAAPELTEIGAGIALHPNAMRALRSLELEGRVRAVAWESDHPVVRDGPSGSILTKTPQRGYLERRSGATGCTVHRADLLDVLAAGQPAGTVQLGARISYVRYALTGLRTIVFGVPQSSGPSRQCCGVVRTRDGSVGRPANLPKLA